MSGDVIFLTTIHTYPGNTNAMTQGTNQKECVSLEGFWAEMRSEALLAEKGAVPYCA